MRRKYLDCRESPGSNCTVAISADTDEELMEVAAQHAVSAHGYKDGPELREELRKMLKKQEESVPA
jgi:predicted small metal-binding protein